MRLFTLASLLWITTTALADDRAPLPPYPSGQAPAMAPAQITVTPAPAPVAAVQAPAQPQTITLNLTGAPAPPPPPQQITLQLVATPATAAAPVAAATAPPSNVVQAVHVRHPGWFRTAVGNFGERLARQKLTWVGIPSSSQVVQVSAPAVAVQAAPQPVIAAEMVSPSPQAPRKNLFRR
jgi:hypothetical protein